MDLRLVESFVQAARLGGFSAAARVLGVSPGAVSQNIKSLENSLGARLFTRTTRQMRLTPEGERFLARCAPALEALDDAARAITEESEEVAGLLRISSTTAFGRAEVLPLLDGFRRQYPRVSFELSLSDQFIDLVAEGFDVAIRGGILPENEYIARLLVPVTPLVCASPGYFADHERPVLLEDLKQHCLIAMRFSSSQRLFAWEFAEGDAVMRVDVAPWLVVNDPDALRIAAEAGYGLAQLGSNLALPAVAAGRLELALTDRAIQTRGLYAVYPTRRYTPRKVTAFVSYLADCFAHRPDLTFGAAR